MARRIVRPADPHEGRRLDEPRGRLCRRGRDTPSTSTSAPASTCPICTRSPSGSPTPGSSTWTTAHHPHPVGGTPVEHPRGQDRLRRGGHARPGDDPGRGGTAQAPEPHPAGRPHGDRDGPARPGRGGARSASSGAYWSPFPRAATWRCSSAPPSSHPTRWPASPVSTQLATCPCGFTPTRRPRSSSRASGLRRARRRPGPQDRHPDKHETSIHNEDNRDVPGGGPQAGSQSAPHHPCRATRKGPSGTGVPAG